MSALTESLKQPSYELRYFALMAKVSKVIEWSTEKVSFAMTPKYQPNPHPSLQGLGPALVLEHSGLEWNGNASIPFSTNLDWKDLKPSTPFGQLPLLTTLHGELHIAQTTAIINYVGKVSGMEGENESFALSQQLLAEGEDIYNLMVKFVPTLYKRLSGPGVSTTKGSRSDYDNFFAETLPKHLAQIQALITTFSHHCEGSKFLPGELYLFSIIHQACLVAPFISLYPKLQAWYNEIQTSESTQKVLKGESKMGNLNQYFQSADSDNVCKVADERL